MTAITYDFKAGDRVRTPKSFEYPDGVEFTITHVINTGRPYAIGDPKECGIYLSQLEHAPAEKPREFQVGDILRRKVGSLNNAAYSVGSAPFEVKKVAPFSVTDPNGQSHSSANLEPVKAVDAPSSDAAVATAINSVGLNAEDFGYPADPSTYADPKHEALIRQGTNLQAVLRRRNEIIAAQQEQLTKYAAALEAHEATPAISTWDTLRDLQKRIGEANAEKGFHEEGDDLRANLEEAREGGFAEYDVPSHEASLRNYYTARLALITTEVAEAIEELRNGRAVDETYYPSETKGLSIPELRKPEGVPSEVADVVIRAFDFADEAGIDLAAIIEEKLAYNATRARKHGREF